MFKFKDEQTRLAASIYKVIISVCLVNNYLSDNNRF